ncbi:MAG: DNA methyltransferase [Tepidisphaeraceae bacterium]
MAKNPKGSGDALFPIAQRRHPQLMLAKLLSEKAMMLPFDPARLGAATAALTRWADLAESHALDHKEVALDAEFLRVIFCDALGYKSRTDSPDAYQLERQFSVPGAGPADGALGRFKSDQPLKPLAIIECKGITADLDHDKSNGRTPVQQLWDYLNELPDTPWGILSNYRAIRLYHHDSPRRAYEEFTIRDFRDPDRVRQFLYLFGPEGLLGGTIQKPRAWELISGSATEQRAISDELYELYRTARDQIIDRLQSQNHYTQDQAIHAAQKLLDRVVFIAFAEDRGLLPHRLIEDTYKQVAPLDPRENPRWQNFLNTFRAIDKGHKNLDLPQGYNGKLFEADSLVDDLQFEDEPWTNFFLSIGKYDFRDEGEVNVEVLGNLFERSITELEKRRTLGLFGKQTANDTSPTMPKSAERKRFGVYYTPPEFTRFIVEQTLGRLIDERIEQPSSADTGAAILPEATSSPPTVIPSAPARDLAAESKARCFASTLSMTNAEKPPVCDAPGKKGSLADLQLAALKKLKVVDPACGSGAFLVAAYDCIEQAYYKIIYTLRQEGRLEEAATLERNYPDDILRDNLYGVDLSEQSVEIARLALWLRSARKSRRLVDLSANIVQGNSLVADAAVHARAMEWKATFPAVFAGGGFDCIIGNPPWERLKLQEREFFALCSPDIAGAVNAADRRKLIERLEKEQPDLWQRYNAAKASAEKTLGYVRECGRFPHTGRGDVNTYMLFAELSRQLVAPQGLIGLLVPSGIATDDTTKHFFGDLMETRALAALYDFENHDRIFPDVDGRFKFSVLLLNGSTRTTDEADFVFFARRMDDLEPRDRHIKISARDLKLLNPNTRTCPIFRTRRDCELTKRIYRNIPILVDENRKAGGNPWGIKFVTMFHQTNDAELFCPAKKLLDEGFHLDGNRWVRRKEVFLPLYEAKMIQAYDHRAASVIVADGNWVRQGQTEETPLVMHQNPEFVAMPRFWIAEAKVVEYADKLPAMLTYKDVTSPTNQRTMIAAMLPRVGLMNSAPFLFPEKPLTVRRLCCLLANFNSFIYDFIARQKVGGLHLNFFIVEQLPTLPPDRYDEKCPWDKYNQLERWISDRVLKLTCTADDMRPLADAADFKEGVHKWNEADRLRLRTDLDAAYFHLYGLDRDEVDFVLDQFQGVVKEDAAHGRPGPTRREILDAYDVMRE